MSIFNIGPLTYNDGAKETVVGVVSFGSSSCDGRTVFARVTEAREWIQSKLAQTCPTTGTNRGGGGSKLFFILF